MNTLAEARWLADQELLDNARSYGVAKDGSMIEIFDAELYPQGSSQWFDLRKGIPTASNFSSVMAGGEGKMRASYMKLLAAEQRSDRPIETYKNNDMQRGNDMEAEARGQYAMLSGLTTRNFEHSLIGDKELALVGFIRNGGKGCSPDALVGTKGMLEIKTQRGDLIIDTLFNDRVPPEHMAQCQGNLWVAEREWIDLVIYWPGMPMFSKRIYRDDAYIARLKVAVEVFIEDLDAMVTKLRRMK